MSKVEVVFEHVSAPKTNMTSWKSPFLIGNGNKPWYHRKNGAKTWLLGLFWGMNHYIGNYFRYNKPL